MTENFTHPTLIFTLKILESAFRPLYPICQRKALFNAIGIQKDTKNMLCNVPEHGFLLQMSTSLISSVQAIGSCRYTKV